MAADGAATFYVLRYLPTVPLNKRFHRFTLGRFGTYGDADDARDASPVRDQLEVLAREDAS